MARSTVVFGCSWPWYSHAVLWMVGLFARVNDNPWLRLSAKGEAAVIGLVSAVMVKTVRLTLRTAP